MGPVQCGISLKFGLRDCFSNIGIRVDIGCRVDDVELRFFAFL